MAFFNWKADWNWPSSAQGTNGTLDSFLNSSKGEPEDPTKFGSKAWQEKMAAAAAALAAGQEAEAAKALEALSPSSKAAAQQQALSTEEKGAVRSYVTSIYERLQPGAKQAPKAPPVDAEPALQGWLGRRGPTFECAFQQKWCILLADKLATYDDNERRNRRPDVLLTSRTRAFPFTNPQAPGEAVKHLKETPFGFVVDSDPAEGKKRRLFYFDAHEKELLEAWLGAIEKVVAELKEA